jgi:hypothetical protein
VSVGANGTLKGVNHDTGAERTPPVELQLHPLHARPQQVAGADESDDAP